MMTSYLEPAADKIWGSAGLIITEDGEVDLRPTTEEGWLNVINAATVVAEGGNLLLINGYSPNEADWDAYSKGLTSAASKLGELRKARMPTPYSMRVVRSTMYAGPVTIAILRGWINHQRMEALSNDYHLEQGGLLRCSLLHLSPQLSR